VVRLYPLTRERPTVPDPWFRYLARAVIAAIIGFRISAQFVSIKVLEPPYYIVLVGASLLKVYSSWKRDVTVPKEEQAQAYPRSWAPGYQ